MKSEFLVRLKRSVSITALAIIAISGDVGSALVFQTPAWAQGAATIVTVAEASALTGPMVAGIQGANGNSGAASAAVSSAVQGGIASYPGAAASLLQAVAAAASGAGAPLGSVGTGVGQAVAALAATNPAAATALAAAVTSSLSPAEQAAFASATAGLTINGVSVASIEAAGAGAQLITTATGGTPGLSGFGGGSSPPGTGAGGGSGCIPASSVTRC